MIEAYARRIVGWRASRTPVAFATVKRVDWFNTPRWLEPIGNVPAAEAEARYFTQAKVQALAT